MGPLALPSSLLRALGLALVLSACAAPPANSPTPLAPGIQQSYPLVNRLSWGATSSTMERWSPQSWQTLVREQLHPAGSRLPSELQQWVDGMTISQTPLPSLVQQLEQQRKDADAITDDVRKKAAQQAYQQELNRLLRETSTRHLLRALYATTQVQEQMTWFWLNHFSVHQGKSNLRAMLGDYEEHALRVHALGHFRDLLGGVVMHPAMLRYLDNDQNAVGHINENFARELMELHTLGVDAGYSQHDVQELARRTPWSSGWPKPICKATATSPAPWRPCSCPLSSRPLRDKNSRTRCAMWSRPCGWPMTRRRCSTSGPC